MANFLERNIERDKAKVKKLNFLERNIERDKAKVKKSTNKRPTDPLTKSKGSTANILQEQRKRKKKRLEEIMNILDK